MIMKLLPGYPSERVLREQIALLHNNHVISTLGLISVAIAASFTIYRSTADMSVLIWLVAIVLSSAFWTYRHLFSDKKKQASPQHEATQHAYKALNYSLLFAYLPLAFMTTASQSLMLALLLTIGGLSAASVVMLSPCFVVFLSSVYPKMIALIVSLLILGDPLSLQIAYAATAFLIALTWFARRMENTIRNSIELRFENSGLIQKLRLALTQTDEANRAKSVFLASASHDLRQPLHALGLLTETLGGTPLNQQQQELHKLMMSAVDSTRSMLEALLNISKLDAGAISAEPKPFFVQSIFHKLEAELAPTADEHGLIYRTRETAYAAHSDCFIVELILRNLIANAIRYTHEGGLLIACRQKGRNSPQGKRLVMEVWDTGIGIPDNKIDDIFSEFQQLDNPERDSTKGFGLGLAISQGLAETIDSKITVHSRLGKGSVFRFELPLSSAEVIEDIPHNTAPIDFSGYTVLVIDDDERVRTSMSRLLENWGCACFAAESATDALSLIGDHSIDIMLVDYRLREGLTGRAAIHDIREALGHAVPAIIITGDTAADRIKEAQSVDAMLMHKPASTKQLQMMMHKLLN